MKLGEFFRRLMIVRASLSLVVALIVGAFLAVSIVVSLYHGEWGKAFKIAGLLAFVAALGAWAIVAAKAQTKTRDHDAKNKR